MKPSYILIFLLASTLSSCSDAQDSGRAAQAGGEAKSGRLTQCKSSPCPNTASGEDPSVESMRRGKQYLDAVTAGPSDEKRWTIPIFSDSVDPKELESYLVKSADFRVRLVPEKGHLQFQKGTMIDVFEIGLSPSSPRLVCKDYTINIVNASADHAVIQKQCHEVEYRPNRFRAEVNYYLYDRITHSMRTFWQSYTSAKGAPSPAPDTKPVIAVLPGGYELKWNGYYMFEGERKKLSVRNRYTRQTQNDGTISLVCRDLSQPGKVEPETGTCEGDYLPLISTTSAKT